MKFWKITAAGAALLGLLVWAPATEAQKQCPKGKIKFYTSWPMQGAMIPEGTGMKNGVNMAVEEAGGVVAGVCLEVGKLDDALPQTRKWGGPAEAEYVDQVVAEPDTTGY